MSAGAPSEDEQSTEGDCAAATGECMCSEKRKKKTKTKRKRGKRSGVVLAGRETTAQQTQGDGEWPSGRERAPPSLSAHPPQTPPQTFSSSLLCWGVRMGCARCV